MVRLAVVMGLALSTASCSLLFDESEAQLPEGLVPELQFSFEGSGDDALKSTGTLPLTLRTTGAAKIRDGALDLREVGSATPGAAISNTPASAFAEACQLSREFSFSLWVSPGGTLPLDDTPARIATLEEAGLGETSFTIGQGGNTGPTDDPADFDAITVRTGAPNIGDVAEVQGLGLQVGEPTWMGFSMNEIGQYSLFIDSPGLAETVEASGSIENTLEQWAADRSLSFGATPNGERQWRGLVHHLDVFCQALSQEELEAFAAASDPSR